MVDVPRTFRANSAGQIIHVGALAVLTVPEAERMRDRFWAQAGQLVDREPVRCERLTDLGADLDFAIREVAVLKAVTVEAIMDPRGDLIRGFLHLAPSGRINGQDRRIDDRCDGYPSDCQPPQERA